MRTASKIDHRERIERARAHLEARLDEAVSPADLARISCFSLHHFHRVFRGVTGESVAEHQRRLRLERAARRLRETERPIMDLALDAGYDSHEAFTRAFRVRFEMAPSEFREIPSARVAAYVSANPGPVPKVVLRRTDPIRVAEIRHIGSWTQIHGLFERLYAWAGSRGLLGEGMRMFGRCPDDPEVTPEHLLRFDACIAVGADMMADGTVTIGEIPGGTYAVALHHGPFQKLTETYLALIGRWLPTTEHELADEPVIEAYLTDAKTTPEPDLRTEVWVRLQRTPT